MEAQSLVPYLAAERPGDRREMAFSEHAGDRILDGTEFMTMIRTPRWKLIYFVEGGASSSTWRPTRRRSTISGTTSPLPRPVRAC